MELKKESIQMLRIKNKAAAQATFDEDYNVPDVKPDIVKEERFLKGH